MKESLRPMLAEFHDQFGVRYYPVLSSEDAQRIRQRLRGSAKGARLVEKLLADRKRDG